MSKTNFEVLLFYKYVDLVDPEKIRDEQRALCELLGLKGRIIVAKEGINGTVEGMSEHTQQYMTAMEQTGYFSGINYKRSTGTGDSFRKLSVKSRPEIVTSGVDGLNPQKVTGKYISADELQEWFVTQKEFYIVDMRNDYEYNSGYFENYIPSGMKHFFQLSDVLPRLQHLKDKTIVTVCTGGIRCEKASGFLVSNGFANVYQLKDGIQTYMEKYPNQYFKGKLYVFDKRITIGFNIKSPEHVIVGTCKQCGISTDTYVNCEYDVCHKHYICCDGCIDKETDFAFCDDICKMNYLKQREERIAIKSISTATQRSG